MKFEEALSALKNGKSIKLPERNFSLCMIGKIYYDDNDNRPADILSCDDILRNDWEILA